MFELHTPRLVLRDFVPDDWRAVDAMRRVSEITRYQSWLRLADEAAARQWVNRAIHYNQLVPRGAYNLAVVEHDRMVGWLGWGIDDPASGDYSFGYALLPAAWGQGFMTEAVCAALAYMFGSLQARQVTATCAASNHASARVLEKAGMALVEQWPDHDPDTGITELHCRYRVTAADRADATAE